MPSAHDEIAREFSDNAEPGGPTYTDGLPIIQWREGELTRIVDEAEAALMHSAELQIYQRGPMLVRVVRQQAMSVRHFSRPAGALGIVPVDRAWLIEAMTRTAHWEKWDSRKGAWKRANAPELAASTLLSRNGHWRFPPLLGVVSAPTLRPDGSILQHAGYDRPTATWYDPGNVEFPIIPERPTMEDARAALKLLREVFSEFPFVDDDGKGMMVDGTRASVNESVFLSMLLAALVRRSLPAAPLGAISARVPESGKTALANAISLIAIGVTPTTMRYPKDDEEAAKAAFATLWEGTPIILIDNIERSLQGDWLCVMLTSEKYTGRVLGLSKMQDVSTNSVFMATGNNLVIQGDLRTRTLLCLIDPRMEHPRERKFKRDLEQWLPEHRAELVAAGLTIMRAFVANEEDPRQFVPPWPRFDAWSTMVRAPLVWLGMPDPCESSELLEQDDPGRNELLTLLTHWHKQWGADGMTATQVLAALPGGMLDDDFAAVLHELSDDKAGKPSAKRLSGYLRNHVGYIVHGLKLEKAREDHGTAVWRTVKITGT